MSVYDPSLGPAEASTARRDPGCPVGARDILGVQVATRSFAEAMDELDSALGHEAGAARPLAVAFANANLLNLAHGDAGLRQALAGFLVLNDGIGADLGSRLLYGEPFSENLNGTDFVPAWFDHTPHRLKLYLLGAKPGVAGRAAAALAVRFPRHQVVGTRDGYFGRTEDRAVAAEVQRSGADVVLVAMGNPLQERWLAEHLSATGCGAGLAVGALFDFLAGEALRAPRLVRQLRAEWLYRLAREPRRLAQRYLIGNGLFIARVLRQRRLAPGRGSARARARASSTAS